MFCYPMLCFISVYAAIAAAAAAKVAGTAAAATALRSPLLLLRMDQTIAVYLDYRFASR